MESLIGSPTGGGNDKLETQIVATAAGKKIRIFLHISYKF